MTAKYCVKCGAKLESGAHFCSKCMAKVPAEIEVQNYYTQDTYVQNTNNDEQLYGMRGEQTEILNNEVTNSKYEKIFVEPDENYIASLGDGYIKNFLTTQSIEKCIAILSDKRVYLMGNMININGGKVKRTNMQKTIDIEDITGTGFEYDSPQIWKLICGFLCLIFCLLLTFNGFSGIFSSSLFLSFLIVSIIFFISYVVSRNTFFFIEYAGGCIRFDSSIYGLAESQDFEKQIRRAKNKVKENILNAMR